MKVIGLDGWTMGSHHYQKLAEAFADEKIDMFLIHLGSWGSEAGRSIEEIKDGLKMRDISFYGGMRFKEILAMEKPDAVIFLSVDAFAHRAFNRYCKVLGIPTIHLNHGLTSIVDTDSKEPFKFNFFTRLYGLKNHFVKQLKFFLPTYIRALSTTNASSADWKRFGQDLFVRVRGLISLDSAPDAKVDVSCVYIEADKIFAIAKYKYTPDQVAVVGNPDLISFGLSSEQLGGWANHPFSETRNTVMYIDTGNIDYGVVFKSKEEFVQHIVNTHTYLKGIGKQLIFKPHFGTIKHNVLPMLTEHGVLICSNENFVQEMLGACACITEPSSAGLIPALLGMPLFLAQYDKYYDQEFGKLLLNYPRCIRLTRLEEFDPLLQTELERFNEESTKKWVIDHSGPLPAKDMPKRVAQVVKKLVLKNNHDQDVVSNLGEIKKICVE